MEYTDDVDAFPEESQEESEAVDSLREDLDSDVDFREMFDEQLGQAEDWQNTDRKYRKRLYVKLQDVYTLYVMAHRNRKREQLVESKCNELKIANTRASLLSIRIVKLMLRPSDKTAYQYASVLRYASLKDIACGALADELAKKGHGIAELADRFSKEFPTQQRAAGSPDSGGGSMGPNDDDQDPEADASNDDDNDSDGLADDNEDGEVEDDGEVEEDDPASDHPEVDWGPKALKKWRKFEVKGGDWLFVEKLSKNRARIIKKSKPK